MGSEGSEGSKGSTGFPFWAMVFPKHATFFSAQDDEMRRATLVKPVEPFLQ